MKKNFKKNMISVATCIIICMIGFSSPLHAQSIYKINDSKDIDMKLSGTSTLHKWSMDAKTFSGDAQFGFKPGNDAQLTSLKSLNFSLVVQNLKSGEKGLDKNAYKALKTDQYKDIDYKLISTTIVPEKNGSFLLKTHGTLTIAGVTKEITMDVFCVINKDASVTCTGSDKLNMSDYKVKPPSFMLGAMKTGDAITLNFTLVYKKQAII
jgi:polyisoprenoid-binding protein YceI